MAILGFIGRGRSPQIARPWGFCGVWGVDDPRAAIGRLACEAVWADGRVALGGAPVGSDRTGEIVVCGDIVLDNAADLRSLLGLPGAHPAELIAELIHRSGVDGCLQAMGMFAGVAYNTRSGELLLFRDAVGGRTMYFAGDAARGCWFASRLHVLRRAPVVSAELSLSALQHYLTCAFVPGEQTMWRDAREVAPGTVRTFPGGHARTFWKPRETEWDSDEPVECSARRLRPLLEDAVQRVLPTTGPVGVFLSGGLDSSLVTALANRYTRGEVHTFAVHFGPEHRNELEFSTLVADHCGTKHHVLELRPRTIRDHLLDTAALLDDPIGDPLTTPNLLLARAAIRETNVVLNGEGGDPCFGGPKNLPMMLHSLYGRTESCEAAYLRSFQKCYDDLLRLLTPEVQTALKDERPEMLFGPFFDPNGMSSYLNRLMWINVRLKGADHILTKVNNLTTAVGLLAHAPLFDRRIVEMSFGVPPDHKLTGVTEKAVLKRAVADLLPEAIINRPKSGMLVPVQSWFRKEMKGFARSYLLDRRARTRPYLNQALVREWLDYQGCTFPRHGVKLWLLLTLELWLRAQE